MTQLSVEEFITFPLDNNDLQGLLALNDDSINVFANSPTDDGSSPCDPMDLIDPQDCDMDKNAFDIYIGEQDNVIDDIINFLSNNNVSQPSGQVFYKNTQLGTQCNNIPLSQSVGVTLPKTSSKNRSSPIQIVHDLELTYKPRYKSDYRSQDGKERSPRYVADQKGNHFVTLKVAPGIQGVIRVDWVTAATGKTPRFSMPYKFQKSHEVAGAPDRNPTYEAIKTDRFGNVPLYLVLIKSKQDELKSIQSLELFPPVQYGFETTNKMPSFSAKKLIQHYQLDKSQLAFTFCTIGPNGTYVPDWGTTVYSSVLTEEQPPKKRMASCPNCSHSFEIQMPDADDIGHEKVIKKRKK